MAEPAGIPLLARRRFTLLLGGLCVLLLVAPFFDGTRQGEGELGLLFSGIVAGFVLAAERRRQAAAVIAGVWLVLTWSGIGAEAIADLLLLALCLVTIESVLAHVLSARRIDTEVISASIGAYVLMGIAWAVVYTLLEAQTPGAFSLAPEETAAPWSPLLYFSFATQTTLGYGDVAPVSATARAWATVQAMGGTLYLAILIARLVSLYRGEAGTEADPGPAATEEAI